MKYGSQRLDKNKYEKQNPYFIKEPQIVVDPARFDAKIGEYGIRVLWEQISECPNFEGSVNSNSHVPDCKLCDGSFVYYNPQEIWALFSQDALVERFYTLGTWDHGTAVMTFPTTVDGDPNKPIVVSYFDRVTLLDQKERYRELIHKSGTDTDRLRYSATDILFLRTVSTIYQYHKDFEVDRNGNIHWTSPNRPHYDLDQQMGELFTVSYLRRPVYRVMNLLHEGRYSQYHFKEQFRKTVTFPQQANIKKDFLCTKQETEKALIAQTNNGIVTPARE